MSEDIMKEEIAEEQMKPKKKDNIICLGLDIGTMYICCSRSNRDEVKTTRNVFLSVDKDEIGINKLTDVSYVKTDDDELYIIGNDAFDFANLFAQNISRPMEHGLISPKEIAAIDVLTLMITDLIGNIKDRDVYCSFSVPAKPVDIDRSVIYHENVFGKILSNIGINHTSINEAMAIIYSECAKENFSGVALSFGAGMMNCAIGFKGIQAHTFSTSRSGDWIDTQVAISLDMIPNRVTNIKEKYMSLSGDVKIKNKKTKRIVEALYYYYKALIEYTVKKIIKEFDDKVDVEIDEAMPIVISGGTSLPEGFIDLFKNIISNYELPFEVSEIRAANNPLTAVSNGLLIKTIADIKGK